MGTTEKIREWRMGSAQMRREIRGREEELRFLIGEAYQLTGEQHAWDLKRDQLVTLGNPDACAPLTRAFQKCDPETEALVFELINGTLYSVTLRLAKEPPL